jgi:hypothetical protein
VHGEALHGEALHGEAAPAWAHWLEASALGVMAREGAWAYPIANGLHVIGIAVLFGAILAFDLRTLGAAGRAVPLAAAAGLLLPLARAGFALAVATGFVLLAADASHVVENPAFQAKVALIALALANVLLFHWLGPIDRPPGAALRLSAAASIALWSAVLGCGRLIAYL